MEKASVPFLLGDLLGAHFNASLNEPLPEKLVLLIDQLRCSWLDQVPVSAACNGAHSVNQHLARWLLMMRDRYDEDTLPITQALLAEMLGVHRPTVTNAIRRLHRAKLIRVSHKYVAILDRDGFCKPPASAVSLSDCVLPSTKTYPE